MKKWLVTGGCGFIGSRLIQKILANPDNTVLVLDNFSVGSVQDLAPVAKEISQSDSTAYLTEIESIVPSRCHVVKGDIANAELLKLMARDADNIVHLAANTGVGPSIENPMADCMSNVLGTLNVLESARHNSKCRLVFASSGAPVGEVKQPPIHEELPAHPVSPYGASKLAGEGYCSAYFASYGVNTVALRFGNVYGPGSAHKSSVVAKFIKKAMEGEPLQINGDGTQTRDFIYIDDLIEAIFAAVTAPNVGGEVFQIATNRESTIVEMSDQLIKCLATKGISNVKRTYADPLVGDVMRNFSDISKAEKRLGWKPTVTLEQGLSTTLDYFINTDSNTRTSV